MIKSTNLMIGDWVNVVHNGKPRNVQVSYLTSTGIGYDDKDDIVEKHAVAFTPIPLTLELMKKNGWTEIGRFWCKGVVMYLPATNLDHFTDIDHPTVRVQYYGSLEMAHMRCDFVHQFQNILRLCGQKDMADDFKI